MAGFQLPFGLGGVPTNTNGGASATNPLLNPNVPGAIQGLGSSIANIGNAASGIIPNSTPGMSGPQSMVPTVKPNPAPVVGTPGVSGPVQALPQPANPVATPGISGPQSGGNNVPTLNPMGGISGPQQTQGTAPPTVSPQGATPSGVVPTGAPTPLAPGQIANPGQATNTGQLNDIYGATGSNIGALLNEEDPTNADNLAQSIINANAPNVAQGSANLNTGLAAGGISPSSSVSAIENANYQGQVSQQDSSEIAQVNLQEEQMQQQLLESLMPSAQQQQTDSSGWSIFGDVMQGIGDVL